MEERVEGLRIAKRWEGVCPGDTSGLGNRGSKEGREEWVKYHPNWPFVIYEWPPKMQHRPNNIFSALSTLDLQREVLLQFEGRILNGPDFEWSGS